MRLQLERGRQKSPGMTYTKNWSGQQQQRQQQQLAIVKRKEKN
jgi:hypothetical protein